MPFKHVDPIQKSDISYTVQRLARESSPFLSVIHIAFTGSYRLGSGGRPDAYYIHGIVDMMNHIWGPSAIILDLTRLSYEWGDEMDLVLSAPSDAPFVVIVGAKCEPAISTLSHGERSEESIVDNKMFFNSFPAAFHAVRQQVVGDWNAYVARQPSTSAALSPISPNDFE